MIAKKSNSNLVSKKQTSFIKKNFVTIFFIVCAGLVGLVVFYKLFIVKPTYIYVKVKVGQGLWWANTQKPSIWFLKAIQQAKEQKDLTGKPIAMIHTISYYPYYGSNQYDIYVTLRLKVSRGGGSNKTYLFNREAIGVGSAIDLEFSNVQFSGSIIDLSEKPIIDTYVEKKVYLTKKYAYPWEYDEIHIGDSFTNGKKTIFQILDKAKGKTNEIFVNDNGKLLSTETETYQYIIIKALMRVKVVDGQLLYAEEVIISPGRGVGIITNQSTLNDYFISKVE